MQQYHYLNETNLTLINFKKIFAATQIKFLASTDDLNLTSSNMKFRGDTKRLFQHHMIHQVCEEILSHKGKNKKVIIMRPLNNKDTFEIQMYFSLEELNKMIFQIIRDIKKMLPIQIVTLSEEASFAEIKKMLDAKDGDAIQLLFGIHSLMQPVNMSFKKAKTYATKHKLKFLSQQYFNDLKTKQLFF